MNGETARHVKALGTRGVLALALSPVTTLATTPARLFQALAACYRALADGRWGGYLRFNAWNALNSLSYWTCAENLARHGRNGASPHMGTGASPMRQFWFYSLPSLYAYRHLGAVVPLLGMFGWLFAHLAWMGYFPTGAAWGGAVLALALFSVTFYANTFSLQNYNALGWVFVPLGLYGWASGSWWLAGAAWFAASFASFTVVALACALAVATAAVEWSLLPILTVIPAGVKLLTHLRPLSKPSDLFAMVALVAKSIGLTGKNVKYRYRGLRLGPRQIYFSALYLQFAAVFWLVSDTVPLWTLAGLALFLVNARLARFADDQSFMMLLFSTATAEALAGAHNWLVLVSYWLLVSPAPVFCGFPGERPLAVVPRYAPHEITPYLEAMRAFLAPVPEGERVFFAFSDPGDDYLKVFDGQRVLIEAPLFVAAERRVHLFPDWWAVYELNFEGAPSLWGRTPAEVTARMAEWKASYAVVYEPHDAPPDAAFEEAGFRELSRFSWADMAPRFGNVKPAPEPLPRWRLLSREGA